MEAANPLRWLSGVLGLGHLDITALMFVGLLATISAAIGFVLLVREAWAGRIGVRTVVLLAIGNRAVHGWSRARAAAATALPAAVPALAYAAYAGLV